MTTTTMIYNKWGEIAGYHNQYDDGGRGGGEECNVWVAVEDISPSPRSQISNLTTDDPSSALAVVAFLCDEDNDNENHNDD